ncbi:hypothetical protein QZM35_12555 [Burkholderia sp. AU45274]|uniref:hypothetical protein n=1 Tax=Burkholderia sp. AU45274 TaxID=3059205 RepID=UPI00264F88CF|nr:hypothetical protein [Burkholderia sp. AU45274]MDN7488531.1 hypothetical protein [Burkholderia sp. AU45274]
MTEHPILFNEPMSAAARAGRKSQTRRVVNWRTVRPGLNLQFSGLTASAVGNAWVLESPTRASHEWRCAPTRCPYGVPVDHLWVRETYVAFGRWETRFSAKKGRDEWHFVDMTLETGREYRFGGDLPNAARGGATPAWWRRPSIFMPRAAARTLLEVTGVRVERLRSISDADAHAEGVTIEDHHLRGYCAGAYRPPSIRAFHDLWDSLNAARGYGWDTNPWVWVVAFRRIES